MSPPVSPPTEPEKAAQFVSVQHQFERDERRPASSSVGSETAHSEDRRNSVNTLDANQKNRRGWPYAAIFPLPPSQQWRFQQSQCVSSASNHERKESESAAPTPTPAAELRPWDDEGARRRRTYQGDDDDWYTEGEENYRQLTSVANVDFEDAMLSQKPKPWTSAMWKLYFFLLVACLNSCVSNILNMIIEML